jgi:hypothetical protein
MSRKRNKRKAQAPKLGEGETPHFNIPGNDYFLGFKRKKFNELWRWDTLEDVDFSTWKPGENSNHKYGNNS